MAFGVVPLITASGAGAAVCYSMGLMIFFGVTFGMVFTLFVMPMFYTFMPHKELAAYVEELGAARMAEPAHH